MNDEDREEIQKVSAGRTKMTPGFTKAGSEAEIQSSQEGPRAFSVFLTQVDEGGLHADLSDKLQKLGAALAVAAAQSASLAKGKLTLELSFAVAKNGTVSVDSDVKIKEPKIPAARSIFWLTKGNNLSAENPRQQKLSLREAPSVERREAPLAETGAALRDV